MQYICLFLSLLMSLSLAFSKRSALISLRIGRWLWLSTGTYPCSVNFHPLIACLKGRTSFHCPRLHLLLHLSSPRRWATPPESDLFVGQKSTRLSGFSDRDVPNQSIELHHPTGIPLKMAHFHPFSLPFTSIQGAGLPLSTVGNTPCIWSRRFWGTPKLRFFF